MKLGIVFYLRIWEKGLLEHDHESESIALKQIFLMLNGVVSYEQLRKSVTKWTLLVKKVQYNVFLILEGMLKN